MDQMPLHFLPRPNGNRVPVWQLPALEAALTTLARQEAHGGFIRLADHPNLSVFLSENGDARTALRRVRAFSAVLALRDGEVALPSLPWVTFLFEDGHPAARFVAGLRSHQREEVDDALASLGFRIDEQLSLRRHGEDDVVASLLVDDRVVR